MGEDLDTHTQHTHTQHTHLIQVRGDDLAAEAVRVCPGPMYVMGEDLDTHTNTHTQHTHLIQVRRDDLAAEAVRVCPRTDVRHGRRPRHVG